MHSKDYLEQELRAANLHDLADEAKRGMYHDFLTPLTFPKIELYMKLTRIGTPSAIALRSRLVSGEFDASSEEAAQWLNSAEGAAAISVLRLGPNDEEN
jgi:hypothetical protein